MDYYAALGVARTAPLEEIKKAYRGLAFRYHPDRNHDLDAAVRFREVALAYEILSDPAKRSLYDLQGFVGRRSGSAPPTPPKPSPPKKEPKKEPPPTNTKKEPEPPKPKREPFKKTPVGDRNPTWDSNWDRPQTPHQHELDAINCMFFGPDDAGRNILIHLHCSLQELQSGCKKTVKIKRRKSCSRCAGDGVVYEKCHRCGGKWWTIKSQIWNAPDRCPVCNGGMGQTSPCPQCEGVGLFPWEIKDVPIVVPPGTKPGFKLIFAEGEDGPKGQMPGKLHIVLI